MVLQYLAKSINIILFSREARIPLKPLKKKKLVGIFMLFGANVPLQNEID